MLLKGWIAGEWGHTVERRRARYYRLTAPGKRQLERELESYKRVTAAVALVIQST
jgi:DNA-binding PadR family transcriptional regulator